MTMTLYVDPNTSEQYGFDETQTVPEGLVPCSPRPSPFHSWVSGAWTLSDQAGYNASVSLELESVVQNKLDLDARAAGYDSIISACSYAGAPNAFQAEAISFLAWRAAAWEYCYDLQAKVHSGARPIPTPEELLAELPTRVLP